MSRPFPVGHFSPTLPPSPGGGGKFFVSAPFPHRPFEALTGPQARNGGKGWGWGSVAVVVLLLSGCAPIERQQSRVRAWWATVSGTASGVTATVRGTANTTVEAGRQVMDTASGAVRRTGETLEEFQDRVRKVQEGARKIQEGKKLIQEGVR